MCVCCVYGVHAVGHLATAFGVCESHSNCGLMDAGHYPAGVCRSQRAIQESPNLSGHFVACSSHNQIKAHLELTN